MKQFTSLIAITACFLMTAGCSSRPEQFTEKKLVIPGRKTVKIKELDLSITNNGCGREWISEPGKPAYERAYCDLVVRHKDSTILTGRDFKPVYIDNNIELTLDKINPWGFEEDSVPPGGCRVWVRLLGGR